MEDNKIIELYFARDEQAIYETKISYGRLLLYVAGNILSDEADCEECENDTYMRAWNSIPPTRPTHFSAFLTKITRNLAIDKLRKEKNELKARLVIEELCDAIPSDEGGPAEDIAIRDAINGFLGSLNKTKRMIFVKRYFYMRDVKAIASEMGVTVSRVKTVLFRLRKELRVYLEERGIVI